MALDWNKELTFGGTKKRQPSPNTQYPSKTFINLAASEKKPFDARKNVPIIIILLVVVALFLKFGVFDFYARVDAKQAELATARQTVATLNSQLTNYNQVQEEYESYAPKSPVKDGLQIDALKALTLVDNYIAPVSSVAQLTLTGDTMSLNLTGITLDGVGQLVKTLEAQDIVKSVSVSTAATQQTSGDSVMASLVITFNTTKG